MKIKSNMEVSNTSMTLIYDNADTDTWQCWHWHWHDNADTDICQCWHWHMTMRTLTHDNADNDIEICEYKLIRMKIAEILSKELIKTFCLS